MSHYVLDKAYRVATAGGIEAGHAVIRGAAEGECDLPAAAGSPNVLGIATHNQLRVGRHIAIRRIGIVAAVAAGAIDRGDLVRVADNQGRIGGLEKPLFTTGSTGANNALRFEWLDRASFSPAVEIDLEEDDAASIAFGWRFEANRLVFRLQKSGDAIVQTAASLLAAVNGDATLSHLIKVSHATGSSGAGVLTATTAHVSNLAATINPIGIAEQSATQAGDLVDVFLIP